MVCASSRTNLPMAHSTGKLFTQKSQLTLSQRVWIAFWPSHHRRRRGTPSAQSVCRRRHHHHTRPSPPSSSSSSSSDDCRGHTGTSVSHAKTKQVSVVHSCMSLHAVRCRVRSPRVRPGASGQHFDRVRVALILVFCSWVTQKHQSRGRTPKLPGKRASTTQDTHLGCRNRQRCRQ